MEGEKINYKKYQLAYRHQNIKYLKKIAHTPEYKVQLHPKYLIPMAIRDSKWIILTWLLEDKTNHKMFIKYFHLYDLMRKSNEH